MQIMPEPFVILYKGIPNHLIGPTSDFILPQEEMSVAALAGFKLILFPPLIKKEVLDDQVHCLISVMSQTLAFKTWSSEI